MSAFQQLTGVSLSMVIFISEPCVSPKVGVIAHFKRIQYAPTVSI